jgi:AcrR family transcriptional regulator
MSSKNSRTRILDAALSLITRRGGADVTMAEIADAARVSRQAVYLHFGDRGALLVALARHADEKRGLAAEIRKIAEAPAGVTAVREMVALQARMNPGIWALARALDAVSRVDKAAERSWQDRLQNRLDGCRAIVARLQKEHALRPGLNPDIAADLLWTMTSLRMWDDLVLQRGWSAARYEAYVSECLLASLTTSPAILAPKAHAGEARAADSADTP